VRLDKYLKVSRIIKRRTVANDACGHERVTVNGKTAKPSQEVKAGDVLEIRFGAKTLRAEVLSVREFAKKEDAAQMYRELP
jgi:ribosomal 50S subunit-recycling heat shock protein